MNKRNPILDLLDTTHGLMYEMGRKKRKRTRENFQKVQDAAGKFEAVLIAYDCLNQAIALSKDKKQISADAERFMAKELERVAGG